MRRLAGTTTTLLLTLAAASACGSEGSTWTTDDGVAMIATTDDVLSVRADDWTSQDGHGVQLALQDADDPARQLLVTTFDDAAEAEEQAVFTATGLSGSGVFCERGALGTRSVLDCPFEVDGTAYRKIFVVLDGEPAALVLFQVAAETRDEAFADLASVLAGGQWEDGTPL